MTSADAPFAWAASLALAALGLPACDGCSPEPPAPSPVNDGDAFGLADTPGDAIRSSLAPLLGLVGPTQRERLGFLPGDDLSRLQVGERFAVYTLRYDSVAKDAKADVEKVMAKRPRWIYPLDLQGEPRSSVTVREEGGRYRVVAFGGGSRIRLFREGRRVLEQEGAKEDFRVIQVPELNTFFVGAKRDDHLVVAVLDASHAKGPLRMGSDELGGYLKNLVEAKSTQGE